MLDVLTLGKFIVKRDGDEFTVQFKTDVPRAERPAVVPPVGLDDFRAERKIWPGGWIDATGYCQSYSYGWHTGADLNLNEPTFDADAGKPVYSIAAGVVYAVRVGQAAAGWGSVVAINHGFCLSRYGHVENIQVQEGQRVAAGDYIADIGNASGLPYHLHFDIARPTARMAEKPLDWPGRGAQAKTRILRDYLDPASFLYGMTFGWPAG